MLGRNTVPKFGQTSIIFHGSGIQNHNGHLQAGRDIIINSPAPQACDTRDDAHRRKEVLNSLKFDQMGTRQGNIKRAHAHTCQWFLETQEYKTWLDMDKFQEHGGILWIKGKPGVGKSTLMKHALDHTCRIMKSPETCILSFFFNARGSELEKSTTGLYRALLMQLLKAYSHLQHILDGFEEDHQWGIELLKQIFEQVFHQLDDRHQLICFIDALDECKEQEVRELVGWLSELSHGRPLHVCLASRHFPNISVRKGLHLVLENRQEHIQDIWCYVQDKVHLKDDRHLTTQIRVELQTKAAGIFIWVVLVVDMLHREYDAGQKHKILEKIRELPHDLHELFRDIFTRNSGLSQGLLLCLQWLLFAKYPLTPRQLYFAIISGTEPHYIARCHSQDISDDDIERYILNTSRGLAEITKSWRSTVQFIHESVKDFLLKEDGLGTLWEDLQTNLEGRSQDALKECCFRYQNAVYALLHQTVSSALEKRLLSEIVEHRKVLNRKYPFLEYANDGVLHHADQAQRNNINQTDFLGRFSTKIWSKLQDVFDVRGTRWYWPNVSLLYVLTAKNYSALILASSLHSCFDVEDGPYGTPVFVALATKNVAALESLLEVFIRRRTRDGLSRHDQIQSVRLDYDRMARNSKMRDFVFSPARGVASHLAEFGCSGILKIWLELDSVGISGTEQKDDDGWTPLSYAAQNGGIATIRLLIQRGADVNNTTNKGWTPLHLALLKGHPEAAKLLIDKGADVAAMADNGSTPLAIVLWNIGHLEIAKLLLNRGAILEEVKDYENSPLYEILGKDRLDFMKLLSDHGLHSVATMSDEYALPHWGLSNDQTETMRLILEGGADTDIWHHDGLLLLFSAIEYGYADIIRLLLDRGAIIDATCGEGRRCLFMASKYGRTEIARLLLDRGADISARCHRKDTPLHAAAASGRTETIELLLERGADIHARNLLGEAPIHQVCRGGYSEATLLLFDRGANINAISDGGMTCLLVATEYGRTEIVRLLLDRGANVNASCHRNDTPLHVAAVHGYTEIVELLLEHGADVNARNILGETPLHDVCKCGNETTASLLLDSGADASKKSLAGITPWQAASKAGNEWITSLLVNHEACASTRAPVCGRKHTKLSSDQHLAVEEKADAGGTGDLEEFKTPFNGRVGYVKGIGYIGETEAATKKVYVGDYFYVGGKRYLRGRGEKLYTRGQNYISEIGDILGQKNNEEKEGIRRKGNGETGMFEWWEWEANVPSHTERPP